MLSQTRCGTLCGPSRARVNSGAHGPPVARDAGTKAATTMPVSAPRSDAILERDARVRELVEARPCACGDEFARGHLLLRTIDTVERDQLAAAQIAGAEAVRCGIAAHDHSVMPVGYPDDNELQ